MPLNAIVGFGPDHIPDKEKESVGGDEFKHGENFEYHHYKTSIGNNIETESKIGIAQTISESVTSTRPPTLQYRFWNPAVFPSPSTVLSAFLHAK